jgi:N-acetylated-alpha-linked acidic dipeptidase
LAAASSSTLNFAPLRAAIKLLQFASLSLDAEKFAAERILKDQLRKWRKHHKRQHKRKNGYLKRFIHRLKNLFTWESHDDPMTVTTVADGERRPWVESVPAWIKEQPGKTSEDSREHGGNHEVNVEDGGWPHLPLPHWPHRKPHHLPDKLIKAAKAVRKINKKLASFERGFIHEDGIKDREWYRHLGVAPGKWLGKCSPSVDFKLQKVLNSAPGYGATTLPALTEAITIEKNATLANYEIVRLTEVVENMAAGLRA